MPRRGSARGYPPALLFLTLLGSLTVGCSGSGGELRKSAGRKGLACGAAAGRRCFPKPSAVVRGARPAEARGPSGLPSMGRWKAKLRAGRTGRRPALCPHALHDGDLTLQKIIRYGNHKDQFGELYVPPRPIGTVEDGFKWPVVIVVHGGFWQEEYRLDLMYGFSKSMAQQRIAATWNIEYRRVRGAGGFPETFQDVAEAVDYLSVIAPEYSLDLDRVIIVGHSAGGHLAAWAAVRDSIPEGMPGANPRILPKLAVIQSGVLDLREAYHKFVGGYAIPGLLRSRGGGYVDENLFRVTSPIELISSEASEKPKFIELHPKEDSAVPFSQSEAFHSKALELGFDSELVDIPGEDHFAFLRTDTKAYHFSVAKIQQFLEPDAYDTEGRFKKLEGKDDLQAFYRATDDPEMAQKTAQILQQQILNNLDRDRADTNPPSSSSDLETGKGDDNKIDT